MNDGHPPESPDQPGSGGRTGRHGRPEPESESVAAADSGFDIFDLTDPPTTELPVVRTAPEDRPDVAASALSRRPRDRVRTVARGLGQTLITAGVVVLLFVVYEVYVTDIFGQEKQNKATSAMEQQWDKTAVSPSSGDSSAAGATKVVTVTDPNKLVVDPATRKPTYKTLDGQGFARIYVPSFGADYAFTIIEGTNTNDLYTGPGHYNGTQLPGEQGNFSVAGHRVSKGSPFNELGLLNACDAMVIETQSDWFVYRVLPMQGDLAAWSKTTHAHCAGVAPQTGSYSGVFGREITVPSDYAQVLPVPHANSTTVPTGAERLITLTTCHPQFSDTQRMIIHGVLVKSYAKATGFLPPELNES